MERNSGFRVVVYWNHVSHDSTFLLFFFIRDNFLGGIFVLGRERGTTCNKSPWAWTEDVVLSCQYTPSEPHPMDTAAPPAMSDLESLFEHFFNFAIVTTPQSHPLHIVIGQLYGGEPEFEFLSPDIKLFVELFMWTNEYTERPNVHHHLYIWCHISPLSRLFSRACHFVRISYK